jgi:hypothetical protein
MEQGLDLLYAWLDFFGHSLANLIRHWFLYELMDSAIFRQGFRSGVYVTLVTLATFGFLFSRIARNWYRFLGYFTASRLPVTKDGPTPFNTDVGCALTLVSLLIFVTLAVLLVITLVLGFSDF